MLKRINRKWINFIYKSNKIYWIPVNKVSIPSEYRLTPPNKKNMENKWEYVRKPGKMQSPILLSRDFVLVDGYTSYLIACEAELGKIPVQFVDNNKEFS